MTAAGRSVHVFGIYLMVVGAMLFAAPDTFLALIRQPVTHDPWLRVLGVVVLALGQYYMVGGKLNLDGFIRATVRIRIFAVIAFVILVAMRLAPTVLLLFAAVDAVGAAWTVVARRKMTAS